MTSMTPGSSDVDTDGMTCPDPLNPSVILKFVGTWSEHDPSWEVCTFAKTPTVSSYRSSVASTVTLNPYCSPIIVACVQILIVQ